MRAEECTKAGSLCFRVWVESRGQDYDCVCVSVSFFCLGVAKAGCMYVYVCMRAVWLESPSWEWVGDRGWAGIGVPQPYGRRYNPGGQLDREQTGKTVETSLPGLCRYVRDLPPCLHSLSCVFWPLSIFLVLVLRSRARVGALAGALAPLLAKLELIYGPHCSLLTLHSHKALVQAQVVADGILPGGRVVSEVGKHACEPVVDFIECSLLLWSFQDGPSDEGGVGEWRSHVVELEIVHVVEELWKGAVSMASPEVPPHGKQAV